MTVAYLILAHSQPGHLGRLVGRLDDGRDHIFVHVDLRVGIRPFLESLPPGPAVHVLHNRIPVHRFDFSQVRATLRLLETAQRHPAGFERFVLLSGADFPVKGRRGIRAAFAGGKEFIRVDARSGPRRPTLGRRRILVPGLRAGLQWILNRMPARQFPGLPLCSGSQWWALTRPCAEFILDFVRAHPEYVRFHRFASVPDESFFHSIVKASPFSDAISQDYAEGGLPLPENNVHGAHYIDWTAAQAAGPKVLTGEDLPSLLATDALFGRKFLEPASSRLVLALDEIIRRED